MAGVLYLGANRVSPAILVEGSCPQQPFPVRSPQQIALNENGYADVYCLFTNLYQNYTDLPFYFDGTDIEAIEFGDGVFDSMSGRFQFAFQNSSVIYVDFPNLNHLPTKDTFLSRGAPFYSFIYGTENVHVYFRALNTSTVFQNNVLTGMCNGAANATVHFQSNMETIISNLDGYPSFTGTNTTLAFDLPVTN